jgi:hypothetical protein
VSGDKVYAGGLFLYIGGLTRVGLGAIDATTGVATAWDPQADGSTLALAVSGDSVYAGGYFGSMHGQLSRGFSGLLDPPLVSVAPPDAPATSLSLGQVHPNPFRGSGRIPFALPAAGPVRLGVYDVGGREVRRVLDGERQEAGRHDVPVAADQLRAGVYWYRLEWNGQVRSARMVVLP